MDRDSSSSTAVAWAQANLPRRSTCFQDNLLTAAAEAETEYAMAGLTTGHCVRVSSSNVLNRFKPCPWGLVHENVVRHDTIQ